MKVRNLLIIASVGVATLLAACSSPESKGKKLAEKDCDCQKKYAEMQKKNQEEFLAKFSSYGFKTRTEARQKWQSMQDEAAGKFEQCRNEVQEQVKKVRSEFPTDVSNLLDPKVMQNYMKNPQKYLKEFTKNQEKASKFEDGYRSVINNCSSNAEIDMLSINEKIQSIIPQKPDLTKIKQDLVRRRIMEQPNGYFGRNWAWQINSIEELQEIKVLKEEKVDETFVLDLHLVLQRESSKYEANIEVICVLEKSDDDWRIDFLKTKDIYIVKTGRYNDCITTEIKKGWGTSLQFTNNCDVNLIIGGQILGSDGEWTKFSSRVNANSSGSSSYNGKEYKIDFIERQ